MTEVSVISVQGREPLTAKTIAALDSRGGAGAFKRRIWWSGTRTPPRFPGWEVVASPIERPASLSVLRIFEGTDPESDLLFLEDDVIPCVNAVRAAVDVTIPESAGLVSYFDYRCEWKSPGLFIAPKNRHLCGSQAVKFSARCLQRLIAPLRAKIGRDRIEEKMTPAQAGWDTWFGHAVEDLGLDVLHYSPTLFQHGGAKWSAANYGAKHPYAENFPGENWDAMQSCPDPVPKGSFTEYFETCRFHGVPHPGGVVCRYWPMQYRETKT